MNKILYTLLFVLLTTTAYAQAPQGIPYQAAARGTNGQTLVNAAIKIRFSILDSSTTGSAVYQETHSAATNSLGLFSVNIGMGNPTIGTFSGINWGKNSKFLKAEIDQSGTGSNYSDLGTQQMMSVPYALYAAKSGISTSTALPEVATGDLSAVSYTSAIATDTLNANGGELILSKGICVDTIPVPTINTCYFASGNNLGVYQVNLSGLLPGKQYYCRAFSTNKNGTAYGKISSFNTLSFSTPIISTDAVTNVTIAGAICGGNITSDGGSSVILRGLCYATAANPTINDSKVMIGSGTGSFSGAISGLLPATQYYIRAFATNAFGTAYGTQQSFTTAISSVPVIATDSTSALSYTSAVSGISVSSNGGNAITQQGICWGTTPNPVSTGNKILCANALGHYVLSITGLLPSTTYYVRAFSKNAVGTVYGVQYTFTTLTASAPTLSTNNVIAITTSSAISGGNITSDGGSSIIARGICWGFGPTPTKDSSHTNDGAGNGLFNSNCTGLLPNKTYYLRAYATNNVGTSYGNVQLFTTQSIVAVTPGVPVVGTTIINYPGSGPTAASGGYVSNDGGSTVIARGVCWATNIGPTISDNFSVDGAGLGYFTSNISNLSGCGNYYIRAYATNGFGTGYGTTYSMVHGSNPTVLIDSISSIAPDSFNVHVNISSNGNCTILEQGVCWSSFSSSPTISDNKLVDSTGVSTFISSITALKPNLNYYVRAYITNASGTYYSSPISVKTGIPQGRYLGENYAGGVIFYIDNTGNHGLVCAPNDQGSAIWGCVYSSIPGLSTAVGAGAMNTATILSNCNDNTTAAAQCDALVLNGYSDWFLPSSGEVYLMLQNLGRYNYANLYDNGAIFSKRYMVSNQFDQNTIYTSTQSSFLCYLNGNLIEESHLWKANAGNFRAVRAF